MVRELGRGGLGVVVLARHVGLDRLSAIKRIHTTPGPAREAVARFRREAKALAALAHPAVVRLYDVAATDGQLFLVMEYVEGQDLRHRLDDDSIDAASAVRVLRDVGAALAHGAEHGVVHRDVKPANVFVLPSAHAKLGDFGVARVLGDTVSFRTGLGVAVGSPTYMAPEQIRGTGIGPAADVYGFSVMAYEVMTGRLPFDASGLDETLEAHLHRAPTDPTDVWPDFPPAAARALLRGMAKEPSRRPTVERITQALVSTPVAAWPRPGRPRSARTAAATLAPTVAGTVAPSTAPDDRVPVDIEPRTVTRPVDADPVRAPGWIEPYVYRPVPSRRSRAWWAVVLIPVAIAIGWFATRSSTEPGGRLRVESVSVSIDPARRSGGCPGTTFRFTGRIATNGAPGRVTVRWTSPDGVVRAPAVASVGTGARRVLASLNFSVRGTRTLRGSATLRVIAPATSTPTATSPQVAYSCR